MADLRALALIYDIRGFTAASKRLGTADLGAFATAAHRVILDLFAAHPPTFVKNLGDGHLLIWECADGLDPVLVTAVVDGAQKARTAFAAFATRQREAGQVLPGRVGIGVAFGEVSRSDDYYGRALNLASRLQGVARPEGLALDRGVFEAVAGRSESLRSVFKRANVRLKGLGSTLVWVDRPFSWARLLAPVAKVLAVLAVPLAYLLLCDADLGLPGGEAVRRFADRHEASVFRPVRTDAEVRTAADRHRRALAQALLANRSPQGWAAPSFRPIAEDEPDLWSLTQETYALLQVPDLAADDLAALRRWMAVPFEPGRLVEEDGELWGWVPHPGERYTEAEPTLWTVAMLAAGLARPGFLVGEERRIGEQRLALAQRAAMAFHPRPGGAWNIFPRQDDPARHSPYSTTLALLALLETRAAAQPWRGSVAERDDLLADTAAFLVRSFEAEEAPAGWRRTADPSDKVSAGLTMQVLGELLRAEAEAGVRLPAPILEAAVPLLVARGHASLAEAYDSGEFGVAFTSHERAADGAHVHATRREGINFLWHPWAVDAAVRWLGRARRQGADPADTVRVRRALGRMVVDLGDEAVRVAREGYVFVASETVIGLSSVPVPGAP